MYRKYVQDLSENPGPSNTDRADDQVFPDTHLIVGEAHMTAVRAAAAAAEAAEAAAQQPYTSSPSKSRPHRPHPYVLSPVIQSPISIHDSSSGDSEGEDQGIGFNTNTEVKDDNDGVGSPQSDGVEGPTVDPTLRCENDDREIVGNISPQSDKNTYEAVVNAETSDRTREPRDRTREISDGTRETSNRTREPSERTSHIRNNTQGIGDRKQLHGDSTRVKYSNGEHDKGRVTTTSVKSGDSSCSVVSYGSAGNNEWDFFSASLDRCEENESGEESSRHVVASRHVGGVIRTSDSSNNCVDGDEVANSCRDDNNVTRSVRQANEDEFSSGDEFTSTDKHASARELANDNSLGEETISSSSAVSQSAGCRRRDVRQSESIQLDDLVSTTDTPEFRRRPLSHSTYLSTHSAHHSIDLPLSAHSSHSTQQYLMHPSQQHSPHTSTTSISHSAHSNLSRVWETSGDQASNEVILVRPVTEAAKVRSPLYPTLRQNLLTEIQPAGRPYPQNQKYTHPQEQNQNHTLIHDQNVAPNRDYLQFQHYDYSLNHTQLNRDYIPNHAQNHAQDHAHDIIRVLSAPRDRIGDEEVVGEQMKQVAVKENGVTRPIKGDGIQRELTTWRPSPSHEPSEPIQCPFPMFFSWCGCGRRRREGRSRAAIPCCVVAPAAGTAAGGEGWGEQARAW
ncbi:hypothetical protein Pcinc_012935 [Petrolisthes cinctipes]|uniref:Uncharacterized protein n=1 Tax=Petrolisthes cinctipes TaxID=88211 RepID=A0AAE1KUV2_PETCI|nr:hypothetical protein Pcinc_012935 [Petrolisthes cinctipes]